MSEFATPASPSGIDWNDLNGSLLIVDVREIVVGINTDFGTTDAIRADITIIDGQQAGDTYRDTLVFPKVLQSQLRPNVGKRVLGRLGQGQAKPKQSPPWILAEATGEDISTASEFAARLAAGALTADDI